jgi:signal transduction histidine kinase
VLYNEGLPEAVRWLASQMERQYRLVVRVEAAENMPIPHEDLRVLLFQIVRELLFNVVKHAAVYTATVTLGYIAPSPGTPNPADGLLKIVVSDQGQGFLPAADENGERYSQGLRRTRQRLELIGGHLSIESTPGRGTQVTILCPLQGGQSVATPV